VSHFTAGVNDTRSGNQTNALVELSLAIKLDPQYKDAYFLRGSAKFGLKDYKGAISDFTEVVRLAPANEAENGAAFFSRGLCKSALNDFNGALGDYEEAIRINSNNASAYRYRGMTQAALRNWEGALGDFDRFFALHGGDAESYRICGFAKAALKDYPGALAYFNKVIGLTPGDADAYASRANIKAQSGDFDGANADLEKALQFGPNNAGVFIARGFLKAKRGDDDGASADFNRATHLAPAAPEGYLYLGMLQFNSSQLGPALDNLSKAVVSNCPEDDPRFYIWLIKTQIGRADDGNMELGAYLNSLQGVKSKEWQAAIVRFLIGDLPESDFIAQAGINTNRPSAIIDQVSDAYFYAGMKHLLAGDKKGAVGLFQQCLNAGDDNNFGNWSARAELRALKQH